MKLPKELQDKRKKKKINKNATLQFNPTIKNVNRAMEICTSVIIRSLKEEPVRKEEMSEFLITSQLIELFTQSFDVGSGKISFKDYIFFKILAESPEYDIRILESRFNEKFGKIIEKHKETLSSMEKREREKRNSYYI